MTFPIKSTFIRKSAAMTALALAVGLYSPSVFASDAPPDRQFSAATGAAVNEVLELINSGEHKAVLGKLSTLLNAPGLIPYERSTMYQMQGASYYELNQYDRSIDAFKNAVQAGGLLPKEASQLRLNIAQLLIANGHYAKGAQALEDHIHHGGERKPQHTEILVQAWIQAGDNARALPWAEQWFANAEPKMRKHYDLMNYLYANLGKTDYQADIINQMILRWPDDENLHKSLDTLGR